MSINIFMVTIWVGDSICVFNGSLGYSISFD